MENLSDTLRVLSLYHVGTFHFGNQKRENEYCTSFSSEPIWVRANVPWNKIHLIGKSFFFQRYQKTHFYKAFLDVTPCSNHKVQYFRCWFQKAGKNNHVIFLELIWWFSVLFYFFFQTPDKFWSWLVVCFFHLS